MSECNCLINHARAVAPWTCPCECHKKPYEVSEPERTYTESEMQLERAAVLKEAATTLNCRCSNAPCNHQIMRQTILAIPTDQPALDRHDAERDAPILALLNKHLSGRTYDDVEDAVRNLLQAFISIKGNIEDETMELKAQTAAMLEKAASVVEPRLDEHSELIPSGPTASKVLALILTDHAAALAERVREARAQFAQIIVSGFEYNPGHSDLDNEQPIHVSMTLGDYRKARLAAHRAAAGAPRCRACGAETVTADESGLCAPCRIVRDGLRRSGAPEEK